MTRQMKEIVAKEIKTPWRMLPFKMVLIVPVLRKPPCSGNQKNKECNTNGSKKVWSDEKLKKRWATRVHIDVKLSIYDCMEWH